MSFVRQVAHSAFQQVERFTSFYPGILVDYGVHGSFEQKLLGAFRQFVTQEHDRALKVSLSERSRYALMGAGTGCDAQYLFAEDVLGQNRGHMPRHSKVYRNFAAELDRLQEERVAAFREFVADVDSRAYPEDRHVVRMDPAELGKFMDGIGLR